MSAHTPGPWLVVYQPEQSRIRVGRQDPRFGESIIPVCTVIDQNDDYEKEANARLIAASPELLAACKTILPLITAAHKSALNKATYQPLEAAMASVRAAITKAEKRAP